MLDYNTLKEFCTLHGADLFGVADISEIKAEFNLSEELTQGLDKAICLGVRLSSQILNDVIDAPTKLYFHNYRTANIFLDQLAFRAANYLQRNDFKALPIPASQVLDWQKQDAHLSHKKIGYLAGLGWIGRNNLLINDKLGSNFRLATILTDADLTVDQPKDFGCGECKSCVDACPVSAIKDAPQDFGHLTCFEKLKDFQRTRVAEQFICGICLRVCGGKTPTS